MHLVSCSDRPKLQFWVSAETDTETETLAETVAETETLRKFSKIDFPADCSPNYMSMVSVLRIGYLLGAKMIKQKK